MNNYNFKKLNLRELSNQELKALEGGSPICLNIFGIWSNCYPKGQRWFWQRL